MIHATISGRLGGAPTAIEHESGGCKFSVACDHGYGDNKTTTWVSVSVWGKRGEKLQELLDKGRAVVVRGELWVSEGRDGKSFTNMRADEVELVGPRPEGREPGEDRDEKPRGKAGGGKSGGAKRAQPDDDIPY